ncbi:MAG: Hpt domain-containing protein [Thermoplasmatota archaeon]
MTAVDEGVLRGLLDDMGGDREVVRELIQSFLEEGPKLLAEGRAALVAGDVAEVQRAFHTLKSTAATFGAMPLADRAKEVEQAARGGALPTLQAVGEIAAMFEAAKAELLRRLG